MQILSPQEVFLPGEFDKLQLHDSEDEREKSRYTIEPFINFSADATSEKDRAAWVSGATGLSFEFRTQATINLLVRGPKFKNQYQYFNLCEVCWAVPYARTEDEAWVFQAEYQSNRHASFCSQYSSPNGKEIPIVQVALGRQIKSDTIRFSARTSRSYSHPERDTSFGHAFTSRWSNSASWDHHHPSQYRHEWSSSRRDSL